MDINAVKLKAISKKNEAVSRLVNLNSSEVSDYRYIQGIIHGVDLVMSIFKEIETETMKREAEDD
jgi:hypothetical protein